MLKDYSAIKADTNVLAFLIPKSSPYFLICFINTKLFFLLVVKLVYTIYIKYDGK